jgi:hypothetical protein
MSEEMAAPSGINPRADWRDPSSYQPLLKLDRVGWAWEWLRRNPEFVAAMPKSSVQVATEPRVVTLLDAPLVARWGILFRWAGRRLLESIRLLIRTRTRGRACDVE